MEKNKTGFRCIDEVDSLDSMSDDEVLNEWKNISVGISESRKASHKIVRGIGNLKYTPLRNRLCKIMIDRGLL